MSKRVAVTIIKTYESDIADIQSDEMFLKTVKDLNIDPDMVRLPTMEGAHETWGVEKHGVTMTVSLLRGVNEN